MSSYGHHAVSSSFSADYGLYAVASNGAERSDSADSEHSDVDDTLDDSTRFDYTKPTRPPKTPLFSLKRRSSNVSLSHERTPLLASSNLRSHDEVPEISDADGRFTIYIEELQILSKYTLPVFGTHILEYSLLVAGTISIGHLSTNALAAATLATMTASVSGFSVIQGFASALDTLLPSAWTSSQPNLVGLWCLRTSVLMSIILIPVLAVWFKSEPILLMLKQDPEVAQLASVYLKYLSAGLPAYAVNNITRRYFQSQGLFAVPTKIIIVVAPINAVLNWLLVWGPKPIRLGFTGAPISTAISYNLIAISSIVYATFFVPKTAWHPISHRIFTKTGVLLRLGFAGVFQVGSEWWSWELVGLAASLLGPVSLAAQSILSVSASTTFQAPFALSVAASVRIGNLLGEANARRASISNQIALLMSLVIAFFWSCMFLIFKDSWGRIFNDDPEVLELVAGVLPIVALFQVFDCLSAVTAGILRAQGKQTTGALLNVSAYYVIGIPFGMYLTFKAGMKLWGLWIGLTTALVYGSAIATYICLTANWDHEVKKVQDRIEADKRQDRHEQVVTVV